MRHKPRFTAAALFSAIAMLLTSGATASAGPLTHPTTSMSKRPAAGIPQPMPVVQQPVPSRQRPLPNIVHPGPNVPDIFDGPFRLCDHGSSQRCFNLSQNSCAGGTHVLGWTYGNYTNENINIFSYGPPGYYAFTFANCAGKSMCIFAYGPDTNALEIDPCDNRDDNTDLWAWYNNGTYNWFKNIYTGQDILAWNTNGLQLATHAWDGGNSEWTFYTPCC